MSESPAPCSNRYINTKTILTSVILAIGAWIWHAHGKIERIEGIEKTQARFWKLHEWELSRINEERAARGEPIAEWADIGG